MRNLAGSFTMRKDGVLPRGDWFKIENKESEAPKVYIYDEIGFWGTEASQFVKDLQDIDSKKMELHLNSPGGEIFDGLAIYNALKQHKSEVTVYVDGLAASAASFIAQAGDEVIMARNAQMMIHDGIAFAYGNEEDMLDTAELLSTISNNIADIYAFSSGKRDVDTTLEEFRDLMREEVWYTGKEAVSAGLADTVLDQDDDEAEAAKNKWDLGFYNHAGREKAESPLRVQERIRLANRQKGKVMGNKPKATDTGATPASTPGSETPPGTEENPAGTETPPEGTGTETPPEGTGTETPPEGTETGTQAPAAQSTQVPTNQAEGVLINGKMETDWNVISQHLSTLIAAQEEQKVTFRKEFVEGLATSNKIPATMVDQLVQLVNGDGDKLQAMSDDQFAAFQASYESLPASPLFGEIPTTQPGAPGQPKSAAASSAAEREDRMQILEGTVAMHRRTMSEEQVQKTASYIELQELLQSNNKS